MKRAAMVALTFSILAAAWAQPSVRETTLYIGNGAEPASLDPSLIVGVPEHRIYLALFEGLVTNDPRTSKAVPGVAESWEFDATGTRVTFRLRETTWSDGVPITARTVVDSWLRTLDPATGAEYAYMLTMVVAGAREYHEGLTGTDAVGIRALDDRTFQVDLVGPSPYAVDMMAHYAFAILPMHVIEAKGADWSLPPNIAGNGPYVLNTWKPYERIVVTANPRYWNASSVSMPRIVFYPIDNALTAYGYFKSGVLDWSTGIPYDRIEEIAARSDYQVYPQFATYFYFFNVTRPPFDDVRVRKALALVLDRRNLVDEVIRGGQLSACYLVPPMDGYLPAEGDGFDPDQARKLLAEAGYPGGNGFPPVPIMYNDSFGHMLIADWVATAWKDELGIETDLVGVEWESLLASRKEHDFYVARAGWVGDYLDPNTFLDMFLTGSPENSGLYSDPEYDALVQTAATMPAGPERMDVLKRAETLLVDRDQAVIPLYFYVSQDLIDLTRWDGWYPNPLGIHPYQYIRRK